MYKETKTQKVTRLAIIASLYVVLTVVFSFMSYGDIQVRIAEVLVLLCFFRKDYAIGLIIGCILSNLFSPFGIIDVVIGSIATTLALIGVMHSKRLWIACLWPVLANAILIGLEISYIDNIPFYLPMITVGIGETIAMIVGYFIMNNLRKNKAFMKLIGANQNK